MGNQLFKWAFVVAKAGHTGDSWAVDSDSPSLDVQGLEAWVGPLPWASRDEVTALRGSDGLGGKAYRSLQRLLPPSVRSWRQETAPGFHPSLVQARRPVYWSGYWQSYRYWEGQEALVRQTLRYQGPETPFLQKWKPRVAEGGSVAVHVRRGDYVGNPSLDTLSERYYLDALSVLGPQGPVFVFSDDPGWCRQHLDWPVPFEALEGGRPEEDLYLMSLCQDHIVANSTFSWWGAWLAPRGRTVAPSSWFPSYGQVPPLDDVFPPSWERIKER